MRQNQRGYAMLLTLVFVIMGSLYGIVSQLDAVKARYAQVRNTSESLTLAKEALIAYAATYRDNNPAEGFGYLPCPDSTDKSGLFPPGDGTAASVCGAAGQYSIGLLPYKTLGLPDLRDADGNCLWYAVSGAYKNSPKSAPLNWDAQGQFAIVDSGGATLTAPDDATGGAAAVVFAPGPPLTTQSRTGSALPCNATPAQVAAFLESTANSFAHGSVKDASGNITGNDQLIWISPREIFDRVRKRSDFAALIASGINNIQARLNNQLASHPAGANQSLPASNPFSSNTSDYNFYENWKDHFRYLPCSPLGSYCYTGADALAYDGALLFGGSDASGNPRASTARAVANYFESALALAQGSAFQPCSPTPAVFDNATPAGRAADIALCLTPKPQTIDTTDPTQFAQLTTVVSARPLAFRDDANQRLQLGSSGVFGSGSGAAPLYGCIWHPTAQTLGQASTAVNLRAYFSFYVANRGDGFTFTIADADAARNASIAMCGASGANMGYAGNNGTTSPINYPKIGLEIDRNCDAAYGDPSCASGSYRQLAFVYWGASATLTDDNTHGAGGTGSPVNPASGASGFRKSTSTSFLANLTMQYVRLEMQRTYDATAHRATHVLRAYLTSNITGSGCLTADFTDLTDDIANINPGCFVSGPTISDTIAIDDVAGASGAPLKTVWLGFTNSQGAQDQIIYVYGLKTNIGP